MKARFIIAPLIVLGLLAMALLAFYPQPVSEPYTVRAADFGGDFILPRVSALPSVLGRATPSQSGSVATPSINPPRFDTRLLRGKIVLLYFGFTHCPDICPTTLGVMAQATRMLSAEEQNDVVGVLISVDPARDTPEILGAYTAFFHPHFFGATANAGQVDDINTLKEITHRYRAFFQINTAKAGESAYSVDHTGSVYLLNRAGKVTHVFPSDVTAESMARALREVVRQKN